MKTTLLPVLTLLLNSVLLFSQTNDCIWARSAGVIDNDYAASIATDANGNVVVVGSFQGQTMTVGAYPLSNSGNYDFFVIKYDPNGNVLWAKRAGGNAEDKGTSVAVDPSGDVIVTGFFSSNGIVFGATTLINASGGGRDLFVAKFNGSTGNVAWAISATNTGDEMINSIKTDSQGNIYGTGHYIGGKLIFGTDTVENFTSSSTNTFVVKLDPSGNEIWLKQAFGSSISNALAIDNTDHLYITGRFLATEMVVGTDTLHNTAATYPESFIAKYDSSGAELWARSAGGVYDDHFTSIVTDNFGDVYVSGYFGSPSITLDTITHNLSGDHDMILAKYNSSGSIQWASSANGGGYEQSNAVTIDTSGFVFVTGFYAGATLNLDTIQLNAVALGDVFIAKYNPVNGDVAWAGSAGGSELDEAFAISGDQFGNIFVAGRYESTSAVFGLDTLHTAGFGDIFVAKYGNVALGINNEGINAKTTLSVFPNPNNGEINVQSNSTINGIEIINALGEVVYRSNPGTNKVVLQLDKSGLYFIKVTSDKTTATQKIIVQP